MIRQPVCSGLVLVLLWGCGHPAPSTASGTTPGAVSPAEQTSLDQPPVRTEEKEGTAPRTEVPTPSGEPTPSAVFTPTDERPSISLAFVGDIMLGRSLAGRIARGDGGTIFASVESILQSADLAAGNLECALGEGGKKSPKAYTFRAPPEAAGVLQSAGFDLLSLANNHILDYGADVLDQTRRLFAEAGIRSVGAGSDEAQARAPAFIELYGFRLAFLAYVDVPVEYYGFDPRIWSAGPSSPGVSWAVDAKIEEDIRNADPQADFVIVLFHFGDEGIAAPNKRQTQLSRLAIDNGADVIVGSHPHVLQAAQEYNSRWIFNSLGNFVFDEFTGNANASAILWVTLSRDGGLEYSYMPVTIVDGIPLIGE